MTTQLIDGKAEAAKLANAMRCEVENFAASEGRSPSLAVVLVGDDPASAVYVRNKARAAQSIGIRSKEFKLAGDISERELLNLIANLNADDDVDGLLVQLPLPGHLDKQRVIDAIDPQKDVDGLHPLNVGNLYSGTDGIVPCTPYGCMLLIRSVVRDLSGMEAVVIGRSNIVGRPMTYMLSAANATVTLAHSATQDVAALCRRADLVVSAVGQPEMVRANWIKPGAIVIDVGINRIQAAQGAHATRLVGDVAFDEVSEVASAITPVPGGVGPMTIACLLRNTIVAAKRRDREYEAEVDWVFEY